jgi:uncharacterized phiE125 gp8 family phage protein
MSSILLTAPAVEPITLGDTKAYLRVEHNDDDGVISALIAGARTHVEAKTRRALIVQTWRLVRDGWAGDGRIAVLPVPLRALLAARVVMRDGSNQSILPSAFVIDKAGAPATLTFTAGALPMSDRAVAGIELDVEVGYGPAPADVPEPLRLAIKFLIAQWYENRGMTTIGHEVAELPHTVAAMIAPYRVLSL